MSNTNVLRNITQKTTEWTKWTPLKIGGDLRCNFGFVVLEEKFDVANRR